MSQYLLDESTARSIFDLAIVPALFGGIPSPSAVSREPITVLVGGPPGSGKSIVEARVRQQLGGTAVLLDVDDLRAFHPRYASLARADDRVAASATHADVQRWHRQATAYALAHRIDLVVSTTLRGPDDTASQIERHRAAARRVEVVFLAADWVRSALGVLQRYAADRSNPQLGFGRYTHPEYQRAAYEGLPLTAERVDTDRRAHQVTVVRRGGERLYANTLAGGKWIEPPTTRAAIERERHRPWTPEESDQFERVVTRIRPNLPPWLSSDLARIVEAAAAYRPSTRGPGPSIARQAFPRPWDELQARESRNRPSIGSDSAAARHPRRSR